MRKHLQLLMLSFFVLGLPLPAAQAQGYEKEYREAADQLVCQCGCNEQLTVCAMQNCHSATPMRAEIREKLQAGMGVTQIVDAFVVKFGKKVLAAPTLEGFDLTAWVMPFTVLILGFVVVGWIVVKMARPARAEEQVPSGEIDPRVERELRDFEVES